MPAAAKSNRQATFTARSLSKRYGRRTAVSSVSFELFGGEIVGIIGPNGAGKTTLLSMMAGILEPSEGELSIASGQRFGWVPQQPAVYSKLSVEQNLRLFARLEKVADPDAAVARMLDETGLQERASEQVGRLSGGNQQRVNVAIGLLPDPPALLLDEPSASLDPRQRKRLWMFIGGLARRGTAIVFSTHNVAEVERYATRVLVLVDGGLLFEGTPAELEQAVGGASANPPTEPDGVVPDLEGAFVRFLHERGH